MYEAEHAPTNRSRGPAVVGFIAAIAASILGSFALFHYWPTHSGPAQDVARACALLSLVWACAAAMGPSSARRRDISAAARTVALLLAVAPLVIQLVVLAMRAIYVLVDLARGFPSISVRSYGFGPVGLWSLSFLAVACAVTLRATRDRRLAVCQVWVTLMLASWACLMSEPFRVTLGGSWERTSLSLFLLSSLSLVVGLAVPLEGFVRRVLPTDAMSGPDGGEIASKDISPAMLTSVNAISLMIVVLMCYQLVVPLPESGGGVRTSGLVVAGCGVVAAWACFNLVRGMWHASLADAGMGVVSLGLCGLATAVVPIEAGTLAERYPMIFNAIMSALAVMTATWTAMTIRWRRLIDQGGGDELLERLIPQAKRFAFFNASLALVVGIVMALWPRWPGIAATDDSLGRVAAGLGANLLLLLAVLWSSRHVRRFSFQVLAVLSMILAAGFLLVRMLPFTPRFG